MKSGLSILHKEQRKDPIGKQVMQSRRSSSAGRLPRIAAYFKFPKYRCSARVFAVQIRSLLTAASTCLYALVVVYQGALREAVLVERVCEAVVSDIVHL